MTCGNDRLVFIHVPKTGGTWAEGAMRAAGVELDKIGTEFHPPKDRIDIGDRFAFGFVREPLSWYRSVWSFRRSWQIEESGEFPDEWFALDFPDFLIKVIDDPDFVLAGYFNSFVGRAQDEIAFVGRYENLTDDLVTALQMAGQNFDEEALRAWPRINESRALHPSCPADVMQRLIESEHWVYKRFYSHAVT